MTDFSTLRGTFASQHIRALIEQQHVTGENSVGGQHGIADGQVQPSSLDLTLSEEAYQLPGSMLPLRTEGVRDIIKALARKKLDLSQPTLLDRQKVYLVRLREKFSLPSNVAAYTNNKSSTGRIDLATRIVCDRNPRFDKIPQGYRGELWLEINPKSFDIIVKAGASLNQAIFYAGRSILPSANLHDEYRRTPLFFGKTGAPIPHDEVIVDDGLLMTLDLDQPMVGYVARRTYEPVDLSKTGTHDADEFFDPIERPARDALWLERGRFYIFSTAEYIRVPPPFAAEMLPYDTSAGEFRAHYAGFFDPGFGYGLNGEELGTPAVLEVRAYDDDLIVRHRQPICRMAYERLTAVPDKLYHAGIGSNYARQRGPCLSKFFSKKA